LEALALVAPTLLLTVALDRFGVGLPVPLLVARMRIAPLFPATPHGLGVQRISANLVPMVLAETLPLAGDLAANGLLRVIAGGLEDLLAVTTQTIAHQAGSGSESNPFILSGSAAEPTASTKNSPPVETTIEFCTASPPTGALPIKSAQPMSFYIGTDSLGLDARKPCLYR